MGQSGAHTMREVTPDKQWQPGRAPHGSQYQAERLNPADMEGIAGTDFVKVENIN